MNFNGKIIGKYGSDLANKSLMATNSVIPPTFKSRQKLSWDATLGKLRFLYYTNRGNFFGPVVKSIDPSELAGDDITERLLVTHPVEFTEDFRILNILCVDFENQEIVKPSGMSYPLDVEAGSFIQFSLLMPYYVRGKRK